MTFSRKLLTLGFLLSGATMSAQMAKANSFHDIMDNYFSRNSNGSYSRSNYGNNGNNGNSNNQNATIQASLDSRQTTLRQSIANAQSAGTISNSQASELLSELSTIAAREQQAAYSNGFAYDETASLVSALGAVDTRLQNYIAANGTNNQNYNGNSNFNHNANSYYRQGSGASNLIRTRIRSLRDRIAHEYQDGDISEQENTNLSYRLDQVSQKYKSNWRYNSGSNDVQAQAQLAGIEARLAYDLQNRNSQWEHHHQDNANDNNLGQRYNEH
ncbi:MAG: hypothetical protein KGS72_02435 [Cyanobacteria bacterium REEB67]|nr:hypothetical protein [Cyanobacteria bacterium REEB67]